MFDMSALELAASIKEKKLGVAEVVGAYIDRIEKHDGAFNSFISYDREKAIAAAKAVQSGIDRGEAVSLLAGVPVAVKDNICTKGIRTTCASQIMKNYVPDFSATVVERLEKAGMIVVGKLNMDEFAMGGSGDTGAFAQIRNPWDISRVPGGSSGGSAAAVAAGLVPLSLGSDTGGSIRQPCSFCGTSGIKPTYGAVSGHGVIPLAPSLDQIGPVGKNIDDCAALLSIISGADGKDRSCVLEKPFGFGPNEHSEMLPHGTKIGLPVNIFNDGIIEKDVKNAVLDAAKELEAAGASIEEFELPLVSYMVPVYQVTVCTEAAKSLSRLQEVYGASENSGMGFEAKRRIMFGNLLLSGGKYGDYYKKAIQMRGLVRESFKKLLRKFDIILSPVSPSTAHKTGESSGDPAKAYLGDRYVMPANLAGLPALSIPCGFDGHGLPIGLQLMADSFCEPVIITAARVYQNRTNHHTKKPAMKSC